VNEWHAGQVTTEVNPEEVVLQVSERLRAKFPDAGADEVDRVVRSELAELVDRPVQDYLSVLTERAAKKRLKKDREPV
jgi:hypothetical protein